MVTELITNYYLAFATFQGLCRQHSQKEFSFILKTLSSLPSVAVINDKTKSNFRRKGLLPAYTFRSWFFTEGSQGRGTNRNHGGMPFTGLFCDMPGQRSCISLSHLLKDGQFFNCVSPFPWDSRLYRGDNKI